MKQIHLSKHTPAVNHGLLFAVSPRCTIASLLDSHWWAVRDCQVKSCKRLNVNGTLKQRCASSSQVKLYKVAIGDDFTATTKLNDPPVQSPRFPECDWQPVQELIDCRKGTCNEFGADTTGNCPPDASSECNQCAYQHQRECQAKHPCKGWKFSSGNATFPWYSVQQMETSQPHVARYHQRYNLCWAVAANFWWAFDRNNLFTSFVKSISHHLSNPFLVF